MIMLILLLGLDLQHVDVATAVLQARQIEVT